MTEKRDMSQASDRLGEDEKVLERKSVADGVEVCVWGTVTCSWRRSLGQ